MFAHQVHPSEGPGVVSLVLSTLGSPLMPPLPAQQQLQLLSRFCQEQGIPFPSISPSPEEQCQPQECHLFCDPAQPEAPAVLHFPLVNDSFQDYSAPGEPCLVTSLPALPQCR